MGGGEGVEEAKDQSRLGGGGGELLGFPVIWATHSILHSYQKKLKIVKHKKLKKMKERNKIKF